MSSMRNWHTEDIDKKNLIFSVFLTGVRSKRSKIHNHYKVLISEFAEIAK